MTKCCPSLPHPIVIKSLDGLVLGYILYNSSQEKTRKTKKRIGEKEEQEQSE